MKESLYSQGKPIFRETFNSLADTSRIGGTVTGVNFSNGTATFVSTDSDFISYRTIPITGATTVILRQRSSGAQSRKVGLCDTSNGYGFHTYFTGAAAGPLIYVGAANYRYFSDPNLYNSDGNWHTWIFVISGLAIGSIATSACYVDGTALGVLNTTSSGGTSITKVDSLAKATVGGTTYYGGFEIEYMEVYNYAFSASQAYNYSINSTFKDIRNGLLLDLDSRQGVLEDKMGNTLTAIGGTNTLPRIQFNRAKYSTYYYEPSGYPIIADADKFSFGNGTTDLPFSISCWAQGFKTGSFALMSKLIAGQSEYVFGYNANTIIARLYDQSAGSYIGRTAPFVGATKNGSINHFVMTYSGNGSATGVKIYINGAQADTANSTSGVYTAMENTTAQLKPGRWDGQANHVGYLDIARLYNRELSANEVSQLYTSQKPYFL